MPGRRGAYGALRAGLDPHYVLIGFELRHSSAMSPSSACPNLGPCTQRRDKNAAVPIDALVFYQREDADVERQEERQ
jgi:hypothetical protein